ncbi:hypothetical protein BC826DRAFT_959893 [Russula brevipes]|nr:hypothetical protein BC826DRAFT_959893 [Russula brevipes]
MFQVGQISYRPLLSFKGWAQSLQDNQLESNDQYKIQNWSSALFAFWNSTLSARALQGNEAEIRRGVDLMVQLAFQLRLEANHIVQMEKDLPLPGSPGKAIADLIAMMKLPLDWIKFLSPLKNQHVFNAGLQPGNVITFLYEAKCNDETTASHQLSFYLCSAQHQHQAIGFTDGQLFGAILNGSILKIYASWWEHNTVMIYPTQYQLPLGTFPEFLTCYIFLCKLANHIAHGVDAVFQD